MKTGKPPRLSEKLNAELETMRADHAASMQSQLESFRNDFSDIATSALHTIKTDIRYFLSDSRSELQSRSATIRRWLTVSPWVIVGLITAWIASTMAMSWLWMTLLTSPPLSDLGVTRIDREDRSWLILDPTHTELKTCTLAETPVICIEIEER